MFAINKMLASTRCHMMPISLCMIAIIPSLVTGSQVPGSEEEAFWVRYVKTHADEKGWLTGKAAKDFNQMYFKQVSTKFVPPTADEFRRIHKGELGFDHLYAKDIWSNHNKVLNTSEADVTVTRCNKELSKKEKKKARRKNNKYLEKLRRNATTYRSVGGKGSTGPVNKKPAKRSSTPKRYSPGETRRQMRMAAKKARESQKIRQEVIRREGQQKQLAKSKKAREQVINERNKVKADEQAYWDAIYRVKYDAEYRATYGDEIKKRFKQGEKAKLWWSENSKSFEENKVHNGKTVTIIKYIPRKKGLWSVQWYETDEDGKTRTQNIPNGVLKKCTEDAADNRRQKTFARAAKKIDQKRERDAKKAAAKREKEERRSSTRRGSVKEGKAARELREAQHMRKNPHKTVKGPSPTKHMMDPKLPFSRDILIEFDNQQEAIKGRQEKMKDAAAARAAAARARASQAAAA